MKHQLVKANRFSKEELPESLLAASNEVFVKKGQHLYKQGDRPEGITFIQSGLIALVNISPNGTESLLRVFGKEAFLGYRSFCAGEPYHADALALMDSTILELPFENLHEVQKQYPEIMVFLTTLMAKDLRVSEERFNDLTGKRVASRVIDALIFLKQKQPDYLWTRKEIGEFCGAKTETVTRTFSSLESMNLIEKDGRAVKIIDLERMIAYKSELDLSN